MKISLNWLKNYIKIEESTDELASILTMTGLEVEGISSFESVKGGLQGLVVGEVLTCEQHPNADRLKVTTVNLGKGEPVQIICGAPNVAKGQKVVVAPVGTLLHPTAEEPFELKKSKIRGEYSEGMICAEDEIGLGTDHQGVIELDPTSIPGSSVSEIFKIENDVIFEIGLTPNRGDATSHIGVARDIRAALNRDLTWPSVDKFKIDNTDLEIEVEIIDDEACPRYSGLSFTNIKVGESPKWLQNRLRAIGLSPINNLVDITNFVMHETGQPLHAFDADKITGRKVLIQKLKAGTKFVTLDEVERKLSGDDLMICNSEEGMCIAGVFGGIHSGITATTTNVFLESAYFSPDSVRKTSMVHGLKTDAGFRFERGTDPNLTVYALKRAAMLFKEFAGATISSEIVDKYPRKIEDRQIKLEFKNINRLIGKVIDHQEIIDILARLDISCDNVWDDSVTVSVPPYRYDVTREVDVIEEILRIYGLNNIEIPEHLASSAAEFPEKDVHKYQSKISRILAANGFYEIVTNPLTKPAYSEALNEVDSAENVEILNKLSEDLGVMRQALVFSGLEVIVYNLNRKQGDLKFFEFGKVYKKKGKGYSEKQKLGLFITGDLEKENWIRQKTPVVYHDIVGIAEMVIEAMTEQTLSQFPIENSLFTYGASLRLQDREIGMAGRINSKILRLLDISKEIFYAEVDWDLLLKISNDNIVYEEVSKYPEVRRDLSLVLNKSISFDLIRKLAHKEETYLIKEMNVFDLYEGANLGKDKKALAITFILQDKKKTLTDKVIDKAMKKLMDTFENELGAIIRK